MADLKFSAFTSRVELPFYSALFASKLNVDKLDDSARFVLGTYEPSPLTTPEESTRMQILANALTSNTIGLGQCRAEGTIKNVNTMEAFKSTDKSAMLQTAGRQIWDAIKDGTIYSVPSLLSSFTILSFANLKKYQCTYWFAFPALHSEPQWAMTAPISKLDPKESESLVEKVGTWKYGVDSRQHGFFLVKRTRGGEDNRYKNSFDSSNSNDSSAEALGFKWEVGTLHAFEDGFFKGVAEEDRFVSFVDPSNYAEHPAWPLRNLLVLVRQRFHLTKVNILCYRDTQAKRHETRSIILSLAMDSVPEMETTQMPKVTGWERNATGKLQARQANLAEYMNPATLIEDAVDLNLKLMKWRISPNLDLDSIKNTSCLILGAGALGGNVALDLAAWGVRKITFVDYGKVSFSNPVRQPLYVHKDALDGAPKAARAAKAIKEMNPGLESEGHALTVPMLGHRIIDEAQTEQDFAQLKDLVDSHDAIFLLTDSRESRWLPTVMGKAAGKIVMNSALGFDTFVVMRHGATPEDGSERTLGCYFCNDIVVATDSQKDATLDQQCTVTRPGVAPIAAGLLGDLFVSILQHPARHHAPAPKPATDPFSHDRDPEDHPLGLLPHQIRGFLSTFENRMLRAESYPYCSACSKPILEAYEKDGWHFVKKALEDEDYIAELSGLAEVQRQAEAMAAEVEFSDDEGEAVMV